MTATALRAVLFDSGGVLIRPIGGRWNPRADFEETVLAHDPTLMPERFTAAVAAGDDFLAASPSTPDYDDYHRVLLHHLGVESTPRLLAERTREVPATTVLEIFPEVPATLAELRRRGVRMAVVSDAWASLPALHAELGIAHYFEAYAISAVLGCLKPDPRMYRTASEALGLAPEQCVFVDDAPELVKAAIELGYEGRVLYREDGQPATANCGSLIPSITTLTELVELF